MKKTLPLIAALCMSTATIAFAQTSGPLTPPAKNDPVPSPGATAPSTPPAATPSTPSTPPTASAPSSSSTMAGGVTLTDDEAQKWIDKVIYSSDGANLGEVAAFARDSSGKVTEMHGDVGGLMGVGETRVRIMPSQFKLEQDRVTLNLTKEQAKALPQVTKTN